MNRGSRTRIMIFYFSGTGNSFYVAQKLKIELNEKIINLAHATKTNQFEYGLDPDERIGFVFPVYWTGLPLIVLEFVGNLKVNNYSNQYVYSIITNSGYIGAADRVFAKLCEKKICSYKGVFR